MSAYWISVTDGVRRMRTVFVAPDVVFAYMKALYWFAGTPWQVLEPAESKAIRRELR
jgi:hypothetical protein